jgi:hypothetical protein
MQPTPEQVRLLEAIGRHGVLEEALSRSVRPGLRPLATHPGGLDRSPPL